MSKTFNTIKRLLALCLALVMVLGGLIPATTQETYAAAKVKKMTLKFSHTITYGPGEGGYTNLKVTDFNDSLGSRPVLCMQPKEFTPPDGTYTIDKTLTNAKNYDHLSNLSNFYIQ